VRIWPLTARSSLVIFDRYLHDMLADPLRYRWAGPAGLLKAASRLVPQPDLWIVLDAPAEVLQARKQEVSLDASQAQRDAYRRLAADLRGARLFDTSLDVQHCTAEICDYVLSHMRLRLHARLGLAIQDATP